LAFAAQQNKPALDMAGPETYNFKAQHQPQDKHHTILCLLSIDKIGSKNFGNPKFRVVWRGRSPSDLNPQRRHVRREENFHEGELARRE
jgi:hypothetical protein